MSIAAISTASSSATTSKSQRSATEPSTGFEGFFADASQQMGSATLDYEIDSADLSLADLNTDETLVDVSDFAEEIDLANASLPLEPIVDPQLTPPSNTVTPFDFLAWAESARNPAVTSNGLPTISTESTQVPSVEETLSDPEITPLVEESVALKQQTTPQNHTTQDLIKTLVTTDGPEEIATISLNVTPKSEVSGLKFSPNQDLSNSSRLKPSKAVFERIGNYSANTNASITAQPIQLSIVPNADVLNNFAVRQVTAEESMSAVQGKSSLQLYDSPKIVAPTAPALHNTASIQEKAQETMKWMLHQRIQSAEIRMNPEELGPISVRVRVEGGETLVAFYAHHETTRQLLEQSISQLKDNMQSSGLQLSDSFVGKQSDQSSFGEFHQGQPEHGAAKHSSYGTGSEVNATNNESDIQQSMTSQEGRVDIFA